MALNENIVVAALLNDVVKDLNSIINVLTTVQCEVHTVESIVNDVMEELLILVCESPSEDAPPESLQIVDISVKGTFVSVEDGQGDTTISGNFVFLPAKGVKVMKFFCEFNGLLDPGITNTLLTDDEDFLPRCGDASNVLCVAYVASDEDSVRSRII